MVYRLMRFVWERVVRLQCEIIFALETVCVRVCVCICMPARLTLVCLCEGVHTSLGVKSVCV